MGATSFSGGHTAAGAAVGSSTPSTQAHADSAASGSSAEAARVDHKHAMPAAGGVSQADQTAIEGETNQDTYIPPDLVKHSPGVAKAYCIVLGNGTLHAGSYNVASTSRAATGDYTVTWDVDFADVNYSCHVTPEAGAGRITQVSTPAEGTLPVLAFTAAGAADDTPCHVVAFGTSV
jgi:hypothetical protein